jgi:hypothetical protein
MRTAIAAILFGVVVACSTPAILTPPTAVPGGVYPCGINGVVCADGAPLHATGMCCDTGEVCGGIFPHVGCPTGACCFVGGEDEVGARRAPRPVHGQRKAAQ